MSIYKAYDMRGIYPSEIDEELFYQVGRRLPHFLGTKDILVARDARSSSESLHQMLVKGLLEAGAHIVDSGQCSTPHAYFSQHHLSLPALVMVTASHNPKEYNGLKIAGLGGVTIGLDQGLDKLELLMQDRDFTPEFSSGTLTTVDTTQAYLELIDYGQSPFPFSVVIDQSNSSAVAEVESIKRFCSVVAVLNSTPDGDFPGHSPNPLLAESHVSCAQKVLEVHADMGVIFDGDCDRVVFIDEQGRMINPGHVTALLAGQAAQGTVIVDAVTSKSTVDYLSKNGLRVIREKVGRTNIINRMLKENALLAGEVSGHYMFSESFGKECVPLAVRKLLEFMLSSQKKLSVLADELSVLVSTPSATQFLVEDSSVALEKIKKAFAEYPQSSLDGVSIEFGNGSWCNLRPSNTEKGLLRVSAEAHSQEELTTIVESLKRAISS